MKPFYSIQEIANLLDENVHATCNALVASNVNCYFNGKKVDLTEYDCFRPIYSGETIFVRTGCAPGPDPDTILVPVEALPVSWSKRIEDSVVKHEKSTEINYREPPDSMPKSRLVSITSIVKGIGDLADSELTFDEITDALNKAIDGNTMIYDGSWKGLCPAIDGNPYDKNSGFNRRQDIIVDFFNSKYWERQDCIFKENGRKIDASDYMVSKDDAVNIAQFLWWYFYPNTGINIDAILGLKSKQISNCTQAAQNTDPSRNCTEIRQAIHGQTFDRLQRAVAAFPGRYPDYKTKQPKLDNDVRAWLKEVSLAMNDREAHVFGVIIAEHFDLSGDTQKT